MPDQEQPLNDIGVYYILNPVTHEVTQTDDVLVWAAQMETTTRVVNQTWMDEVLISTVFLGLNHRYTDNGPPLVFETMIFGGALNDHQWRHSTWETAEKFHIEAVRLAKLHHTPLERLKARIVNSKFWRNMQFNLRTMIWKLRSKMYR